MWKRILLRHRHRGVWSLITAQKTKVKEVEKRGGERKKRVDIGKALQTSRVSQDENGKRSIYRNKTKASSGVE